MLTTLQKLLPLPTSVSLLWGGLADNHPCSSNLSLVSRPRFPQQLSSSLQPAILTTSYPLHPNSTIIAAFTTYICLHYRQFLRCLISQYFSFTFNFSQTHPSNPVRYFSVHEQRGRDRFILPPTFVIYNTLIFMFAYVLTLITIFIFKTILVKLDIQIIH